MGPGRRTSFPTDVPDNEASVGSGLRLPGSRIRSGSRE